MWSCNGLAKIPRPRENPNALKFAMEWQIIANKTDENFYLINMIMIFTVMSAVILEHVMTS